MLLLMILRVGRSTRHSQKTCSISHIASLLHDCGLRRPQQLNSTQCSAKCMCIAAVLHARLCFEPSRTHQYVHSMKSSRFMNENSGPASRSASAGGPITPGAPVSGSARAVPAAASHALTPAAAAHATRSREGTRCSLCGDGGVGVKVNSGARSWCKGKAIPERARQRASRSR